MKYGGTEAFIMNYYRNMNHKFILIDFVYQGDEKGIYDDELLKIGSKIFRFPYKNRHPVLYSKELKKLYLSGDYKIVHSHMDAMGVWPLAIAKYCHIPVRIAHSHNTFHQTKGLLKFLWNEIARLMIRKSFATHFYACGEKAGRWLFGNKKFDSGEVILIHNAIDTKKFEFSQTQRLVMRNELALGESLVIGHIGQFRKQKNHVFVISVFCELLKFNPQATLLLIGDGELKNEIYRLAEQKEIMDNVIFLGQREDIEILLNSLDAFILPSLFEGFSVVAVEAQCNGVPCFLSDISSEEVHLTDLVSRLCLSAEPSIWAKRILMAKGQDRRNYRKIVSDCGYEIKEESRKLQERYCTLLSKI